MTDTDASKRRIEQDRRIRERLDAAKAARLRWAAMPDAHPEMKRVIGAFVEAQHPGYAESDPEGFAEDVWLWFARLSPDKANFAPPTKASVLARIAKWENAIEAVWRVFNELDLAKTPEDKGK